ncbi:hypothetical protein ONA92_26920 [Mycobacteroides salmoniphilum]|uniref:hypothetical protein n=1 Tax=Mycobacteroides salmoniphilum TaxID=404941 RepID=UPI00356B1187
MAVAPDRYDALRREWIHNHWGHLEMQRRRVEMLDIQQRRRISEEVLNAPSRRDDYARNPLAARGAVSLLGWAERIAFWVMMLFVPLGWLAGKGLYRLYIQLIPQVLRSYPIVPMLWLSLMGVLIPLVYDPGAGVAAKLFWPWLAAQIPALFLFAGMYGIVEGWLAVPGSLQAWPGKEAAIEMNAVDAAEILGADNITPPPLIKSAPVPQPGSMTLPVRNEVRR